MQNESNQKENEKSNNSNSYKKIGREPIDITDIDGSEDPGSELDSIREYNKKQDSEKEHPKPQADETLNPGLITENDI